MGKRKASLNKKQSLSVGLRLGEELSPPWVQYYNEIRFSVGQDPDVSVGALIQESEGVYFTVVTVNGNAKAEAISTLLRHEKEFGGVLFRVFVQNTDAQYILPIQVDLSPFQIAQLFLDGLTGNTYFETVKVQDFQPGQPGVYPIFKALVIQFPNDDIGDYYGNYNNVATLVFADVLKDRINGTPILYSTSLVELP